MAIAEIIRFHLEFGKSIFKYHGQIGRPILDFLHIIFDNLFYFFLFIAMIISTVYLIMSLYMVFSRKRENEKVFAAEKAPFVTIQIPTYNEIVALRCAKKCLEFEYPKDKFEIIIGDDSNDKSISEKIDLFAKRHEKVIVTRRGNNIGYKAGNLNYMLKKSKGDILVLFDSDFVPEKDFIKRIVTPFIHDENVSAVQSRWNFIDKNKNFVSILGSTIIAVFHHICLPFMNRMAGISFLWGSAEAVRRKDLVELGKWKTGSLTEDIEFSLRLLKKGKKIIYLDKLECFSEVPFKAKDLYKQQMRWAYGVIYSFKEHSKTLWFKNENMGFKEKSFISFFCCGYLLSFLLLILFSTGALSFITHAPGPIDLPRFFTELGRNVLLTSGIVIASVVAMIKTKNIKKFMSMIAASFSFGLIVTYYVNVGVIKVLLNKPMQWYMLSKKGNVERGGA